MLDPCLLRLGAGRDALEFLSAHITDAIGDPFHDDLGAAREVAKRSRVGDKKVREAGGLHAEIGAWTVSPFLFERLPAFAANIDPGQSSRHGVKTGREDDDVKLVLFVAGLD